MDKVPVAFRDGQIRSSLTEKDMRSVPFALTFPGRLAGVIGSLLCGLCLVSCGGGGSSQGAPTTQRYAYVINFNDTIWTFSEDAVQGTLSLAANQVNSGWGAHSMVLDPRKTHLYVANNGGGGSNPTVTIYSLTAADHRPVQVGTGVPSGPGAGVLAMAPSGAFLYVGGDTGIFTYRVATDGTLTQVGAPVVSGRTVTGLAVDPSGHHLYASSGYTNAAPSGSDNTLNVFALDAATGVPTATGASYSTPFDPGAIQMHPSGLTLYVMSVSGSAISQFTRNTGDGSLVSRGALSLGTSAYPMGMTLTPGAKFLYVATFNSGGVRGFLVNGDGTLTSLGAAFEAQDQPQALAVDPDGQTLFTANYNNTLTGFRIDATTGHLTFLAKSPMGGDGHAIVIK